MARGLQMALEAHSEQQYDSDGSDEYKEVPERSGAIASSAANPAATPVSAPATGVVGTQAPVADPPPWSQRAASYPPWSQCTPAMPALRAATLPSRSQRSAGAERLAFQRRDGAENMQTREEGEEEEKGELEEGGGGVGAEGLLSQLSSR